MASTPQRSGTFKGSLQRLKALSQKYHGVIKLKQHLQDSEIVSVNEHGSMFILRDGKYFHVGECAGGTFE